jgi:cell division protein FtsB
MAKKSTQSKYVKVEVRPASHILKIILILLILFSIVALIALRWVHNGILTQIDELKDEASGLEYANEVMDQKTEDLGSVQSIQDIAKEELGLVDPDTILIDLD